jgi:hydroxyacyl-ACP dehydratase HTD2-like protein with hotdog domain
VVTSKRQRCPHTAFIGRNKEYHSAAGLEMLHAHFMVYVSGEAISYKYCHHSPRHHMARFQIQTKRQSQGFHQVNSKNKIRQLNIVWSELTKIKHPITHNTSKSIDIVTSKRQICPHTAFIGRNKEYHSAAGLEMLHAHFMVYVLSILEDPTVVVKCRTAMTQVY